MPAIALLAVIAAITPASARDQRHYNNGYNNGYGNNGYWENQRDARRVGAVAGVVAMGVASSAGNARVDNAYDDCTQAREYYGDYRANCEQQRYYDQRNARRGAVVTGVVVGRTARIIAE